MAHLEEVRAATALPVLRKDFVLDPWQVWEARAAGADAVLLIVAALTDAELRGLLAVTREAGLDALVEVHDRAELDRALAAGSRIVGVNNRDLRTLAVSLETALALAPAIPDDVVAVAESGIRTGADVRRLRDAGFDAFLVGEHLMSAPDPGRALRQLVAEAEGARVTRVFVKVCGITSPEDGVAAAEAGADAIGFVFWPKSPRAVTPERARAIGEALPPFVVRVGVFVDAPRDEMARVADAAGLDLLQLHGDEPPEAFAGLPRRALKAVRVGEGFAPEDALRYDGLAAGLLVDTRLPGDTAARGDGARRSTGRS